MEKTSRTFNITLPIQVEVYTDVDQEGEVITFPISYGIYKEIIKKYNGEEVKIRKITSSYLNISFENIYKEGDELFNLDSRIEIIGETLNCLSYKEEVQALSECFTKDVEKLIDFIKEGKYHFYKNASFSQIIEEIFRDYAENGEDVEEYEATLKQKGYFQTSTGVIYAPNKK